VEASAYAHDCEARAAGWSDLQLYGLHPHAPWARLDAMGAGFPIARGGDRVITVASEAIIVAAPLPSGRAASGIGGRLVAPGRGRRRIPDNLKMPVR
jgi:hypothetical protein